MIYTNSIDTWDLLCEMSHLYAWSAEQKFLNTRTDRQETTVQTASPLCIWMKKYHEIAQVPALE
jgi:hypothetical protein